jgi:hypothetical protein
VFTFTGDKFEQGAQYRLRQRVCSIDDMLSAKNGSISARGVLVVSELLRLA